MCPEDDPDGLASVRAQRRYLMAKFVSILLAAMGLDDPQAGPDPRICRF